MYIPKIVCRFSAQLLNDTGLGLWFEVELETAFFYSPNG